MSDPNINPWQQEAVEKLERLGIETEEQAQDLITEILHTCERWGMDVDVTLRMARENYDEESAATWDPEAGEWLCPDGATFYDSFDTAA